MKLDSKFWKSFLWAFFILFFLSPALYILNLHKLYDGFVLNAYHAVLMAFVVVFVVFPFVRGVIFIKAKNTYNGVLCLIGGVIAPVFSGVLAILLIEVLKLHEKKK